MSRLGSMVVRIALENLAGYKADLDEAAKKASDGATRIEGAMGKAAAASERMGTSTDKTREAAAKASTAIDKQVAALNQQVNTFGMSASQATIYKLAMEGATDAQLKQAKAAMMSTEALRTGAEHGEKIGQALRVGALAAAAGAVAAYAAFEKLTSSVAKYQDMAEQTGGDPAGLASLRTAADVGGASIDALVDASNRLQIRLASTSDESRGVGRALAAIGIEVEAFKRLRADEQMRVLGVALNQYADGGGKVAVVQAALGIGSARLISALKELGNETGNHNRLTSEQIALADDYKDAQARTKSELLQYAEALAVSALPSVTMFTGAVKDTVAELVDMGSESADLGKNQSVKEFANSGALLLANVADIAYDVGGAFRFIGNNLGAMAAIAEANLRLDFAGAQAIGRASEEQNAQILKGLGLADKVQARIDAMNAGGATGGGDGQDGTAGKKRIDYLAHETKAVHEKITAYDRLMKSISEKTAADQLDLQTQGNLTAGQKEASKIMDDLRTGTLKLTEAEKIKLTTALESRLATEQEKLAIDKQEKATRAAADAHVKYIADLEKGLDTMEQELQKQLEHNARLGLGREAIAALDAAKLESQAVTLDLLAVKKLDKDLDEQQYTLYKAQAKALRDRAAAMKAGAYKETALEDEKAIAAERQAGWVETDRMARATFDDMENMSRAVGKTLQKAIMSAIYEATIRPIAFQLYTSIAGGVPGGASGGASGLATGVAGNALGGASVFGAGGMTGALAGGAGWVTGSTTLGGSISAATSLMAAEGGFAAGATMLAGAFLPIVAGVAVLAELFKKGEYVQSTGSSVQYFDAAGKTTDKSTLANNFATTAADTYVTGIKDSYAALAKQLGATNAGGMFAYAANNSDGGKFGVQVGVGSANYSTGELKASSEALTLEASRAVFAALQGSELPKYLAGVFDGITASTATADQINSALTYAQNIKTLHDQFEQLPFENLRDLSLAATKGLIEFSGGLDKLGANLSGYYANFYDEGERQAQTLKNINATLAGVGIEFSAADIAAEDARKKFRALVETVQDLNTENDQRTLAALLSVQGAFADLTTEANAATTTIDAQTEAQRALQAAWSAEGARLDALAKDSADRLLAGQQAVADLRNEATQQYLDAQQRVTDAQRNLAEVLHTTIKGFEDFLGTLDGAQTPTARLAGARQNFDNLTARAQAGDTAAVGQLTASAKTFLDLSKGYSATIQDYRRDEARVRNVLNEGIRAGNAQLALLPKDMQQATDPLKAAYEQLAQATADEQAARVLAIAMQASLTSTEKSLGDKYLDAIKALPDEKALKKFYDDTLSAAADAAKVAAAAAAAAVAILARMTAAGAAGGATADPGTPTATAKDTTLHGVGGIAMFDTGDISAGGGSIGAGEAIAQLNAYAQYNGKDAALARIVELGGTPAMLDRLRTIAGPTASFDVGIDDVPYDMTARVHKGEKIFKASDNRELMTRLSSPQENNNALAAEVKLLRSQNDTLGRELGAALAQIALYLRGTADSTDRIRQLEEKWDSKGTPPNRAVL